MSYEIGISYISSKRDNTAAAEAVTPSLVSQRHTALLLLTLFSAGAVLLLRACVGSSLGLFFVRRAPQHAFLDVGPYKNKGFIK